MESLALDAHWALHGIMPNVAGGIGLGAKPTQWFVPKQTFRKGKVIELPGAKLTAQGVAQLSGLANLTELYVSHDTLADDDMPHLAKFTALKRLTVFAPEVGDEGVAKLKGLKKLVALALRGTAMTTAAAKTFRAMPALRLLKSNVLPTEPKFKAKLAEWKRALPRVTVQPAFPLLAGGSGMGGGLGGRR